MLEFVALISRQPVPMWLFVLSQTLLVVVLSMVQWTCRWREPRRAPLQMQRAAVLRAADPTVTPAVIRPARVRQPTGDPASSSSSSSSRPQPRPSYAWLDQKRPPGIVCGKAVPVAGVVGGHHQLVNGNAGQSPSRAITVVTGVGERSRAPSSGDEGGTRRLRLISASEGRCNL